MILKPARVLANDTFFRLWRLSAGCGRLVRDASVPCGAGALGGVGWGTLPRLGVDVFTIRGDDALHNRYGFLYRLRAVVFFNPDRVPSIVLNGQREPVCRDCVERANPLRKAKGLEAIRILRGAYQRQEVA